LPRKNFSRDRPQELFQGELLARIKLSRGNFPGGRRVFFVGKIFYAVIFHGRKEFPMEGELNFPPLFKKRSEIN